MQMNETAGQPVQPVIVKKYANRRLYNTATSSYVTLDHLCQMVKDDYPVGCFVPIKDPNEDVQYDAYHEDRGR